MSDDALRSVLARIGWTTGELASRLDVSADTTNQWARGRRSAPPVVLVWLEQVASGVEAAGPTPPDWQGASPGRRAR